MKILNKLKGLVTAGAENETQPPRQQTEEEYYTELFTKHPVWNSQAPNTEEALRWQIIQNFLFYITGFHTSAAANSGPLKILDLGCGRGWLSKLLTPYGTVTGIEPIKPVVEYAQQLFPDTNIRHGNAQTLLKSKEMFDIIVCSEVIEHVVDDEKPDFLKNLNLLLHNNGFLILTTPRKEAQEEWLKYAIPGQPVEAWLDERTLEGMLRQSSFTQHYLSRFSIPPNPSAPEIEIYQLWLVQKK
ncbi:MAG: hypothetical protein JWR38_5268 [Mucilaginibacter sp.]|nr:hypothetical protein [Mucilaginibacter sp.]